MNINGKAKAQNTYDAIVIGSGISGGWAAKELTEKGLKVLMLDRGKNVEHVKDYTNAMKHPWEFTHRGHLTEAQRKSHPYLIRDYPYTEQNESFWINDKENPYTESKRFDWYRSDIVGGKSIMWGRQTYRLSDLDFEANLKEGVAVDWPIRYKDIAPWYDYVERFVGISGNKDGLPHLPDGQYQPPMEMYCVEKHVKEGIAKKYQGQRHMIIGRTANLTQALKGRGTCQYRDMCNRGCPFGGYFSTQSSTLPAAMATGNLTLRPNAIVDSVIYDEQKGKATGVKVIDTETSDMVEYYASIVFVNASTIGSAFILLNSTSNRFPNGLGNSSGQLGHNLMDHHFRVGAAGNVEGFNDMYYSGRRPNGIYIPRFRNIGNDKRDYVRGFGYEGGASRESWARGTSAPGMGAGFKEWLTTPGAWKLGLIGYGECLPYYENKVVLNKDVKNKWGQPTLAFDAEFKENEKKMRKDMMNDAAEMLEAAGLKYVTPFDNGSYPGMAIHEMGTARMGRDPKTSVLNAFNQMHDVPNVFVTDGSCMTSSACQNPSLTYMALTARACDYAVKEMKKGNIIA
ncbi:GMC oxidoreductase [Pontibacter silvestris]|uniref:GMC oxidoreductase n=1 Tax=Pontibacter silvestris TaxID=2305183 RepID=A0ABW4X0D2_9BACT|nr:GMC family oxidoreductase [Pontibacter silvestris]MCC9138944.1 GMC family oxidoreductase [Pontibacter silvestris]